MGSKGDAFDNAVAESFFATLKKELVHRQPWPTQRDLGSAVFEYIEAFYNRQRRHSTLDYLSPEEYERENHDHEQRLDTKAQHWSPNRVHSIPSALAHYSAWPVGQAPLTSVVAAVGSPGWSSFQAGPLFLTFCAPRP
jgi:hypothetical protein